MNYFNKNQWVLPIFGGLITLISIFTPTTYNYSYGTDLYYVWMNQLALDIEPGSLIPSLLRTDLALLILSITLTDIIFTSSIVLITSTNIYRKSLRSYKNLRWTWLIFASLIIVSTLTWIIYMEIFYNNAGYSHWQNYRPYFGVIGPFIGASLMIIGIIFAKDGRDKEVSDIETSLGLFKKTPIIFSIIGSFIVIIALFTPATTFNLPGNFAYIWINQLGYRVEGITPGPILWRFNLYVVLFSSILSILIFCIPILLITITSIHRKNLGKIEYLRKKWLIAGVLIVILTLIWIIYMEIL
ncbi:MAG: hypothetical protein ACXACB_07620 [Promethearchaeota archaeon]|jgi:hypothetical protein